MRVLNSGTIVRLAAAAALVFVLDLPIGGTFRPATLLDPVDGLYRTARRADIQPGGEWTLPGLEGHVEVVRDERGVPHIFASSEEDAVRAFGWIVAQDRLFQMDFLRRFTSGRLSEIMGRAALETDLAMRRTGMDDAVRRNVSAAAESGRPSADLFRWFAEGVNAWLAGIEERDLPFEFRLLDYRPEPFSPVDPARIGWNLIYDLTYEREAPGDRRQLAALFAPGEYERLFPRHSLHYVPIVPPEEAWWAERGRPAGPAVGAVAATKAGPEARPGPGEGRGFFEGIGSNNWVVAGSRSTTGAPILAGDMHLSLTLPSIWYEVHMVAPGMDSYGVTVPGVPIPIEAFNRHLGWAYTNTGSDQIDHLALEVDTLRRNYRYAGAWRPLRWEPIEVRVRGERPHRDSLAFSHWGPVRFDREGGATAIRWVGLDTLRTFDAMREMNRATDLESFERALRLWDSPMQNVVYADVDGHIAIRSTGRLPLRADGGAPGLRDGASPGSEWVGRVPFEELPHAVDPGRGYLTSTNQQPADPSYPYYLGQYGAAAYRSVRIDELLRSRERHSVEDVARHQSDVVAGPARRLASLLDGVRARTGGGEEVRRALAAWDGEARIDAWEPLAYDEFLRVLSASVWDEPVFERSGRPSLAVTLDLVASDPGSAWFDRPSTDGAESAADILAASLDAVADSMDARSPAGWSAARWGDHHRIVFRHVTMTPRLGALWRGPYPYPGTGETLSPGYGRRVTFSASWRMVLDFSGERPAGVGVYAGGPSGNPFSRLYDGQIDDYLAFRYHALRTPSRATDLPDSLRTATLTLDPSR